MVSGAVQSSPPHLPSSCRMSMEPHNGSLPPFGYHRKAHTTITSKSPGLGFPLSPSQPHPDQFPSAKQYSRKTDVSQHSLSEAPERQSIYRAVRPYPCPPCRPDVSTVIFQIPWIPLDSLPMRQFVGLESVDSNSHVNRPSMR